MQRQLYIVIKTSLGESGPEMILGVCSHGGPGIAFFSQNPALGRDGFPRLLCPSGSTFQSECVLGGKEKDEVR